MSVRPRFATAVTALAVVGLIAVTAAVTATVAGNAQSRTDPGASPAARAAALAVSPTDSETVFVPITPCRIVDTRLADGPFPDNATRTYRVGGTSGFPNQGGASGGCGIPLSATAVAFEFTANSPADRGYIRAWPSAISAEPNTTVLNYSKSQQNTAGAIVPITTGTSASLKVRNHHGPVDLAIDVTGYYAEQIHARVTSTGVLDWSTNRVVSSSRLQAGVFLVTADRSLTGCAATASAHGGSPLFTSTAITGSTVIVYLWLTNGNPVDAYFYVDVSC